MHVDVKTTLPQLPKNAKFGYSKMSLFLRRDFPLNATPILLNRAIRMVGNSAGMDMHTGFSLQQKKWIFTVSGWVFLRILLKNGKLYSCVIIWVDFGSQVQFREGKPIDLNCIYKSIYLFQWKCKVKSAQKLEKMINRLHFGSSKIAKEETHGKKCWCE